MSAELKKSASDLLDELRFQGLMLSAAESCTGGLISACLTDIPGSSDVLERGFVTYSNAAKTEMLGVPPEIIETYGAVSEEVAIAMASGALAHSRAGISVAVTGIAGPGGGSDDKPVGLVHIAGQRRGGRVSHIRREFGDIGRSEVRERTVAEALRLVRSLI